MDNKKRFIWTTLSILIAIFTVKAVLTQAKGLTFQEFYDFFEAADNGLLILAALCACGYFFFEGIAIARMAHALGYAKNRIGTVYGAADIYFSAITPSASGGQPASAILMMMDGIPAPVTTVILLANLIMFTIAIVLVGVFSLSTHWELFLSYSVVSKILIIGGTLVMIGLGFVFFLLLRHPTLLYNICNTVLHFLEKIKLIRRGDALREKLRHTMEEFHECSNLMFGHKKLLLEVFFWNLVQRVSQITSSLLVFLAAGYSFPTAKLAWHIQSLTAIGSNCVPVPGAMGVADYLMLDGYTLLLGNDEIAVSMELLSRSFSFYVCIFTCAMIVFIAYIIRKARKDNKKC